MNYFEYKGIRSSDMGIRIESKNVFSGPEYEMDFLSIPGRDGDLIAGSGRFPNVQVTYSVFIPAKTTSELAQKITAVKAWLYSGLNSYHTLSDALIAFAVIDYITGVMCAITDKNLSSAVGFKGICRKVLIFTLVGIGNIVDVYVLGQGGVLRTAIIFFYLSNEGVSIMENTAHLGLPIPAKLKEVLEQLHERGGNDNESE